MSWSAYENMFILVIKHIRSRIVADFTDSYYVCEPGFIDTHQELHFSFDYI